MKLNYGACQAFVLKYEGGYVNNPADPGGATNKGITQAVYDRYRRQQGNPEKPVRDITAPEVSNIYRSQYWMPVRGDELEAGLDLVLYDYGVNSGVSRAVKELQRTVGVAVDGILGIGTLDALHGRDVTLVINELCDRRLRFLRSLKTFKTFGRGWTDRVNACRATALGMVNGHAVVTPESVPAPAKAVLTDQAKLKTAEGGGLSVAAVGAGGQAMMTTAQQVQPHIGESILGRAALVTFIALILIGGVLVGYSYLVRIKEAGGFAGFVGGLVGAKSGPT